MKCAVSLTSNSAKYTTCILVSGYCKKGGKKAAFRLSDMVQTGLCLSVSILAPYFKKTASWIVPSLLFCLQWLWLTTYPGLNLRADRTLRTPIKARMWWVVLKCQLLANSLRVPANFWCFISIIYPRGPPCIICSGSGGRCCWAQPTGSLGSHQRVQQQCCRQRGQHCPRSSQVVCREAR